VRVTRVEPNGLEHNIFPGGYSGHVVLVGGSPSLLEQPVELLSSRGLVVACMNNSALHTRPLLWFSGDNPNCYDPVILKDPAVTKFMPRTFSHTRHEIGGFRPCDVPGFLFYTQKAEVPWSRFLEPCDAVPWYNNTLTVAIYMLYSMGFRHIVLAGSDFGFAGDRMYAHDGRATQLERKWNADLYNSLVIEIRALKPYFDRCGLLLTDTSVNSRLHPVYPRMTLEEGVAMCLKDQPAAPLDPSMLPHCSKFASESIRKKIEKWPGGYLLNVQTAREEIEVV
jgi:hypothetical protein